LNPLDDFELICASVTVEGNLDPSSLTENEI
jgi:hypothetical protein